MRQRVALGALEKDYILRRLMRDAPPFETMFPELRALFEERMPRML